MLSESFPDYKGLYFFGSRLNNPSEAAAKDSDYDSINI